MQSLSSCVSFWLEHSLDHEHGGYYNCLDRDGSVQSTVKHVWLQGRQVWMLARLYNESPAHRTPAILAAARLGVEFLRTHCRRPSDNRVYFSVAADGRPVKLQRKVFAECFYVMALSEFVLTARVRHPSAAGWLTSHPPFSRCRFARAVKDTAPSESTAMFHEACAVFDAVIRWSKDLSLVGAPAAPGALPSHSLAIPMITLNVICELRKYAGDATLFAERAAECVPEIRLHVHPELCLVVETVAPDGALIDSPDGRLLCPGHSIESAWFLLEFVPRATPPRPRPHLQLLSGMAGTRERTAHQIRRWSSSR